MLELGSPLLALALVYAVTSVLTELVTNNAVAVLMAPIAAGLAAQLGLSSRPFLVAVMFGAFASFATPIGYQTNTLVHVAGGYRFTDFLKIGVPMNLIVGRGHPRHQQSPFGPLIDSLCGRPRSWRFSGDDSLGLNAG